MFKPVSTSCPLLLAEQGAEAGPETHSVFYNLRQPNHLTTYIYIYVICIKFRLFFLNISQKA